MLRNALPLHLLCCCSVPDPEGCRDGVCGPVCRGLPAQAAQPLALHGCGPLYGELILLLLHTLHRAMALPILFTNYIINYATPGGI